MAPHRIDVHHHILPPDYVTEVGHDGGSGYALTPLARRLMPALLALEGWAAEWAAALGRPR